MLRGFLLSMQSVLSPQAWTLSLLSNIRVVQTGPGLISPVNPLLDKKTLIVLINAGENLLKAWDWEAIKNLQDLLDTIKMFTELKVLAPRL